MANGQTILESVRWGEFDSMVDGGEVEEVIRVAAISDEMLDAVLTSLCNDGDPSIPKVITVDAPAEDVLGQIG